MEHERMAHSETIDKAMRPCACDMVRDHTYAEWLRRFSADSEFWSIVFGTPTTSDLAEGHTSEPDTLLDTRTVDTGRTPRDLAESTWPTGCVEERENFGKGKDRDQAK
jgi:hypothetical protein